MKSIFSTQNLQTFFLRKYCRLPRRGPPGPPPGPPGPASLRGPPCPPPGPPARRGPLWPPPECPPGAPPPVLCGGALGAAACFVSSAIPFHPFEFLRTVAAVQTSTFRNFLHTADARLPARKVHAKRAPDFANLARVFHVTFALLRAFLRA